MSPPHKCRVYTDICPEHMFVHGAEAEELRSGIEEIVSNIEGRIVSDEYCSDGIDALESIRDELQALIDKTDARDSVAFQEATTMQTEEEDG